MSGERVDWAADTPLSTANLNYMNTPAGAVCQFAGAVAPAGWLICDAKTIGPTGSGADYEGDKYKTLYDLIQDTYGGSYNWSVGGKVNLPNAVDRVIIGVGTKALAATGGSETIAAGQLPAHGHPLTMDAVAGHTHAIVVYENTIPLKEYAPVTKPYAASPYYIDRWSGEIGIGSHGHSAAAAASGGHTPSGSAGNNTPAGAAYNPPYIALNIIIKY